MRRIYLVRHGLPEKSTSEKEYIGVTDLPLSMRGSVEARQLGRYFRQRLSPAATVRILTSPLQRCRQTAAEMYRGLSDGGIELPEPIVVEDLHEIDLGEWEGKSLREIRERFPEAYEARGHALGTYRTPGGESFLEAGVRFRHAIDRILDMNDRKALVDEGTAAGEPRTVSEAGKACEHASTSSGYEHLIIVAHAGVIRSYLSLLTGRDLDHLMDIPLPYASVTELEVDGEIFSCAEQTKARDGRRGDSAAGHEAAGIRTCREGICVVPDGIGVRPEELLDAAEISRLYQKYRTPQQVIRHMRKVAEVADRLMDGMKMRGSRVRVMQACLLHDLCRAEKQHARVSAEAIRMEGYPAIAALVAVHHQAAYSEREAQGPLTEAELLFYADKRVQEDRLVSVEERFRESRKKCRSPEACAHHDAMLAKTLKIEKKIIKETGEEI